jgi:hypothetical protein
MGIVSGNCVPVDLSLECMDSYRMVVTNPDSKKVRIRIWFLLSWITNPDLKIHFDWWIMNPANFHKIRPVFTNPTTGQIHYEPLGFEFANLYPVQKVRFILLCSRVFLVSSQITRFMDLSREKIPKMLDSNRFGRIRPQVPQA